MTISASCVSRGSRGVLWECLRPRDSSAWDVNF